ncbi:MAG: hypothetical protein ABEJ85_04480, partial [Haloarculaceae archaeon]
MSGADTTGSRDPSALVRRARERISALAAEDGTYTVACRETGVSPDPVTGVTFESYADAERARDAARAYREAMRRLDPALREYELVVSRTEERGIEMASVRERTDERRRNGLPRTRRNATLAGDGTDEWIEVRNAPLVHLRGR